MRLALPISLILAGMFWISAPTASYSADLLASVDNLINLLSPSTREIAPDFTQKRGHNSKDHYSMLIKNASHRYGVDPGLIRSVVQVESDFNAMAVSNMGAIGLMQVMPSTGWEVARVSRRDLFDPETNIMVGTKFLRMMLDRFNGNIIRALAAYHGGADRVSEGRVLPVTRVYIIRVLTKYQGGGKL